MNSAERTLKTLDTSNEASTIFDVLMDSFSGYQQQKKDADLAIEKLEKAIKSLAAVYNIDYKAYSLEKRDNQKDLNDDPVEKISRDYVQMSNENYALLRDIQFQLSIRDKVLYLINDFNEVIEFLKNQIESNIKNYMSENEDQKSVLRRIENDIELLRQSNEYHSKQKKLGELYLKMAKDLKTVIDSLQ